MLFLANSVDTVFGRCYTQSIKINQKTKGAKVMKSKKVLALMMGAIVASSGMSQTAVQVYAHDEESSSSSCSDGYLGDISFLDEEESSSSSEPMEDGLGERELIRLENFTSERINGFLDDESLQVDNLDNLYVSEDNLVFEPTSDKEARLVCLDEERESNENIVVPEKVSINGELYSVTSIGNRAFYECGNLENVTLPANITRIGDHAFAFCMNLQFIELPASLEIINEGAFFQCVNLQLEVLPENIREIGSFAFMECSNLQLRSLPNGLREINNGTFDHCINLRLERLSKDLEIIDERAFFGCVNLRLVALPENLREIGSFAFKECRNLQLEAALPEGLTRVGREAFSDCINLRLERLPEGLEIIGDRAFFNCVNLRLVALPANLREINNGTFDHCRNLRLEELPEGLTRIGNSAFDSCVNLRLEALPANLREIGVDAFANCRNLRLEELPEGLVIIGKRAFVNCRNLQLEALPEGLEIIGARAFANTGIRTITIPASVTELGSAAFETNSIEGINLAQGSGLNNGNVMRAYGRQLERALEFEAAQGQLRMLGQGIITPVELNAEDPEDVCSICKGEFNEENGEFGRLLCGHYMHLECFGEQVRSDFEQGVPFKCPICRREYNIF